MKVIRDGIVITRKDHNCHGCGQVIPKGMPTYSYTNVQDGIYTLYMCTECRGYCKLRGCDSCYTTEDAHSGYIRECKKELCK
jgi:hypothetical protein